MPLPTPLTTLSRRPTTIVAGLAAVGLFLAGSIGVSPAHQPSEVASRTAVKKPNVIIVLADDMRADEMRYMPNVERLIAENGVTFENSFSPDPLCCPARASLLSGQYPHNHGVLNNHSPYGFAGFDDSRTVATAMKQAGYHTGFVGKYLNGYGNDPSLVTGGPSKTYVPAGWDDWFASLSRAKDGTESGSTYNYRFTTYNDNGIVDKSHRGQYQTNVIANRGMDLVDKWSGTRKPFFLLLSFVAPHDGGPVEKDDPKSVMRPDGRYEYYGTPGRPRWVRGTLDKEIPHSPGLPADGGPAEPDLSDKPDFMQKPEFSDAERVAMLDVARQRAEALTILDMRVRDLVRTLKKNGEWKNTALVFTSDNGYFLGEHRQRPGKIKAHEPSLRVPLVIRGPGLPRGVKRYDPITTVDLTATVIALGHARRYRPHANDGTSRILTMKKGDQGWTAPIVTEGMTHTPGDAPGFDDARRYIGLRTPRYSFIRYATGEMELYDLLSDANEFEGKQDDPAYAGVVNELTDLWYQYKDCVGDECRVALPADLQASPSEERQLTDSFWKDVFAVYGY